MPIVAQGGSVTLNANVGHSNGDPADDAALTLTILDSLGTLVAGFPVAIPPIVRTALGTYHYDWAVPVLLAPGGYSAIWDATVDGADAGGSEPVVVVAPGTVGTGSTLADIRARLNLEVSVLNDAETYPFSLAARNQAISNGYAALWPVGVGKVSSQDIVTVDGAQSYATTIQRLYDCALIDGSYIAGYIPSKIVQTASGYTLFLTLPVGGASTLRVSGLTPYISIFASDAAVDDLDPSMGRLPLLKAKSILFTAALANYARTSSHQSEPASLNVTVGDLLTMRAAAEQEWEKETRKAAKQLPREAQVAFGRPR